MRDASWPDKFYAVLFNESIEVLFNESIELTMQMGYELIDS